MLREGWARLQGSQQVTSWTPPSWFAKGEGRGCPCLPGFFRNRALNLCCQAAEFTGLLQNDLQGDTKFLFLSVNSDTPLGCANFYSTGLELWMAVPVFTVGIGDKLCTSLDGHSLLFKTACLRRPMLVSHGAEIHQRLLRLLYLGEYTLESLPWPVNYPIVTKSLA